MNKRGGKAAKRGKADNKVIESKQLNSKLLSIPSPVLMDLLLFCIATGKDLLDICLTCKKMMKFLYKDSRP